jgi:erythromycin esterase-like protein
MWMWRNEVVAPFVQWLRDYNEHHRRRDAPKGQVAFYGLDLYSMFTSMDAVVEYLEKVSPDDARIAKERYANFERFQGEPSAYGYSAALKMSRTYEREVVDTLCDLRKRGEEYLLGRGGVIDGDELFYAEQNAALVARAEEYYRNMVGGYENTWNLRDSHMADCLTSLLAFHEKKTGRRAKAVVWAHSSHLGDARATSRSTQLEEFNLGQLVRQRLGLSQTFNIAISTYTGSVTAANNWDEPAQFKAVRNGLVNSYEHLFHCVGDAINSANWGVVIRSNDLNKVRPAKELLDALRAPARLERYIGVIYRPDTERASHYSTTKFAHEFDAVLFVDRTSALKPLDVTQPWKQGFVKYRSDIDTFPEMDAHLRPDEHTSWRMQTAAALNELAMQFEAKHDLDSAIEKYDKALRYLQNLSVTTEVNALRTQLQLNKLTVRFQQRSFNEVEDMCRRVLAADPHNSHALLLMGNTKLAKGNKAEADVLLFKAGQALTHHAHALPADSVAPRPLNISHMSEAASRSPAPSKRKDQPEETA